MSESKKADKAARDERALIDGAMKRLERCISADKDNRSAAIDDLNFCNGEQWDPAEKKRRSDAGRPALQFNFLQKFVNQVVGDMLENSPSVKVRPEDTKADIEIAKIRQGLISNIEFVSNFPDIKTYASRQLVSSGYGAWRILTRYTEDNPFIQEIYIEGVRNPFLVYMDPDAKDKFGADAKYGFILEKMERDVFEERYSKGQWPGDTLKTGLGMASEKNWYDGSTVVVAEYFCVESEKVMMIQLEDGSAVTEEQFAERKKEWQEKNDTLLAKIVPSAVQAPGLPPGASQGPPPPQGVPQMPGGAPQMALPGPSMQGQMTPPGPPLAQGASPNLLVAGAEALGAEPKVVKKRETEKSVVKHRVLTCMEILDGGIEGHAFPGKFVPIVLVKGPELNIEGKNHVYSLIRHAKDPQKLANYWQTSAAEMIALAPKSPWLGTARQFEGYEGDYAKANTENFPFLKYNPDPDTPGAPQRINPQTPPVAIFEMIRMSEDSIKSVIGMFNADVGAPGSEQTGKAIMARQRPGDIGTSDFSNAIAAAVLHTGRIINEMIPAVYDSERDVRVRHKDETETFVPVNTTVGSAMKAVKDNPELYRGMDPAKLHKLAMTNGRHAKLNDMTSGKYGVVITTGPSYATQRMESSQALLQLMQSAPQQMANALDLVVRNLDFKDSEELEMRLRAPLLAQGIVKPKPGEQPPPSPPPNPAVIKAQAEMGKSQAQTQIAQIRLAQENARLEEQRVRTQIALIELQTVAGDKNIDSTLRLVEAERKHALEAERIRLERERLEHQRIKDGSDIALRASEQFHARQKQGGNVQNA